jgi:hypothetical protein
MATLFVSYRWADREAASALVAALRRRGHEVRYDSEMVIGLPWREKLLSALLGSDGMVLLWTERTASSQHVAAEVGAVRATPRIALMPVLVGDVAIPDFIKDLFAERVVDLEPATIEALASGLDRSIAAHLAMRNRRPKDRPRIFISHRHKDEPIVRELVSCIEANFEIAPGDIRCTSVRPYRLPVGQATSERLRDEVAEAEVVLGILTPDTLQSNYVAFELGAAWGQRVWTCPLLARGADQKNIPDPIRDLSPLFLTSDAECLQLLGDMQRFTTLKRRDTVDNAALLDRCRRLAQAAAA